MCGRSLAILDEHDGGDDPDLEPLRQEWALLGVDLDELGLQVLLGQDSQVLVHNLGRGDRFLRPLLRKFRAIRPMV